MIKTAGVSPGIQHPDLLINYKAKSPDGGGGVGLISFSY